MKVDDGADRLVSIDGKSVIAPCSTAPLPFVQVYSGRGLFE
jgi:hypothetical protein